LIKNMYISFQTIHLMNIFRTQYNL